MLRTRLIAALNVALLGVMAAVYPVRAQEVSPGSLGDLPLPGGLQRAMQAVGDPAAPDHGQFLFDFIRRVYTAPPAMPGESPGPLASLLSNLDRSTASAGETTPAGADSRETLPLGLPPAVWNASVFGGRAAPGGLLRAILQSRSASLLYYGALSLDDATRSWLAGQPELVADVASRYAAAFVLAAPALRIADGAVRVPGGASAQASWETLAGARVGEPAAFVRALLARDEGRLAYLFGTLGTLTEGQIRLALRLDARNASDRIAAAQRMLSTFRHIAIMWDLQQRTFWRPASDPALLASDLRLDARGNPFLPGTQRFWSLVFNGAALGNHETGAAIAEGAPVDFGWLSEQIFKADVGTEPRRYRAVLFASRLGFTVSPENARDSVDAVRAALEYPALAAVLERARVREPAILARAVRRADQLSSIGNEPRGVRAITQFQGTLAVLARAASRRSLPDDRFAALVTSLCGIDPGERGDYDGALVRWIDKELSGSSGELDAELLQLVSGTAPAESAVVTWEGTRYRVDLAHGEALRVSRLLGEDPRPYMSSAAKLVSMADTFREKGLTVEELRRHRAALSTIGDDVGWSDARSWAADAPDRYRAVVAALGGVAHAPSVSAAPGVAGPLLVLADDLLARGLLELTYATALGQPERAWVTAGDVASRHILNVHSATGRKLEWELPAITSGLRPGFGVTGSLLGLDEVLAELSLVRLSSKPPPRRPMLNDVNRRAFIKAVTLIEPARLTDQDLGRIVAAMQAGRARTAALRSGREAVVLAEELRLSPARASLLSWTVEHEPARASAFLSPGELLQLGLGNVDDDSTLHAWGAPALSRTGSLCLRLPRREPGEVTAGRWGSGVFASAFPDLNLRLAELLAEMQMPAALLGPVLASATLDFVNTLVSRDEDDRRGLVEFVQGLDRTRLEQYLALLTTDGPLVPLDDTAGPTPVSQATP